MTLLDDYGVIASDGPGVFDLKRERERERLFAAVRAEESNPHRESISMRPTFELSIICPDDGTQTAFRGTCPKCGGRSWVPAGEWGGYSIRRRLAVLRTEMKKVTDAE